MNKKIVVVNSNNMRDFRKEICELDFVPNKGDRLFLDNIGADPEYVVDCVMHHPSKNIIVVFAQRDNSMYGRMMKQLDL